ncbi:hypothetical protein D3C86_1772280 [compost metagenome]
MQLVGGFDQLLLGAFGDREILAGIFVDHMTVGANVSLLKRIVFVEPFAVKLSFVGQTRPADFQLFAANFRLRQAVFGIVGLDHPAQNRGICEGVMQGVAALFDRQTQLARPLLADRQRRVDHVLLGNTHFIAHQLGDNRHVASLMKLTALLPDQQ